MRVFVTGATGFVGRALIPRLQRDGHAVVAWVRSPARARGLLGAEVELVRADTAPDGLVAAIERSDAVVNLAGEPLMGGRWTAARRAVLEGSRISVQSSGAVDIGVLRTSPLASGLFHRAIASSGPIGQLGGERKTCAPSAIHGHSRRPSATAKRSLEPSTHRRAPAVLPARAQRRRHPRRARAPTEPVRHLGRHPTPTSAAVRRRPPASHAAANWQHGAGQTPGCRPGGTRSRRARRRLWAPGRPRDRRLSRHEH